MNTQNSPREALCVTVRSIFIKERPLKHYFECEAVLVNNLLRDWLIFLVMSLLKPMRKSFIGGYLASALSIHVTKIARFERQRIADESDCSGTYLHCTNLICLARVAQIAHECFVQSNVHSG